MKKNLTNTFLSFNALLLIGSATFAQEKQTSTRSESLQSVPHQTFVNTKKQLSVLGEDYQSQKLYAGGCDTINFAKGFVKPYKWGAYTWTTGTGGTKGYIGGINTYNDKEKGNYIDLSSYAAGSKITSVLIWFGKGYSSNLSKTVTVNVYDNSGAGGIPGAAPIGNSSVTMATIKNDVSKNYLTTVAFSTPVTIPASKKIYVTCDLSQLSWTGAAGTDSLSIYASDTLQENPGIAWEKFSDGTWHAFSETNSWKLKQMALYIFPCITSDATAPSVTLNTNPADASVCAGSPITFDPTGSVAPFGLFWSASSGYGTPVYNGTKISLTYNTPGTYSYHQYADGCGYEAIKDVTFTVKAKPALNTTLSSASYCAGAAVTAQTLASTPAGATFNWTNNNSAIGLSTAGTGNIPAFTAANATAAAITATVAVTPVLNGCSGTAGSYTITVKPLPTMSTLNNTSLCKNNTVNPSPFVSTPAGANFVWTNSNTAIGLPPNGTGNLPSFTATTGSTSSTGTITVTPTLNGCTGNSASYTLTVNIPPTVTAVSSLDTICAGNSATFGASSPTGISFSWLPLTGLNNANNSSPIASPAATTTYTVTTTDNNGCTATATLQLNVKFCTGITQSEQSAFQVKYDWINQQYLLNFNGNKISDPIRLNMFNAAGQQVPVSSTIISHDQLAINTAGLSKGIYFIRGYYNNQEFGLKLMVE